MKIPATINPSFNEAVKHLIEFHPVFFLGNGPALDMGIRPRGLRTNKQWSAYLNSLATVLEIGRRNDWLRLHVNRRGQLTFWLIDISPDWIKERVRPIWSDE